MKAKTRKCKNKDCGKVFEKNPKRAIDYCCSVECYYQHSQHLKSEKEKKEQKEFKAKLKENTKTLSDYEAEAKKAFQKWIRLRDNHQPCISCGNTNTNDWAGGHFFPAGMYSGLMFDERNCHKQCNTYCNKNLSGNLLEYRKGLVSRYGEEWVRQLEADSNEKRDYKYTKQELIAKKLQYELKLKELKK